MTVSKDWWTAQELAEARLPGLPGVKRKINELAQKLGWASMVDAAGFPLARPRKGQRGGGLEYSRAVLPPATVAALVKRGMTGAAAAEPTEATPRDQLWSWFEVQPEKTQTEARRRLKALSALEELRRGGHSVTSAVAVVSAEQSVSAATLYEWRKLVKGAPVADWLPRLTPQRQGGAAEAEIHPDVWRLFKSDYLRPEQPTLASCWRRARDRAEAGGLTIPHVKTFQRRIEREVNPLVVARMRGGTETLRHVVPPLQRSVLDLHALEAVNIDGHEWDVRVDFGTRPDGSRDIGRPMMVMLQDLYSRKLLAWRIGRSESAAVVQLAFADLFRNHGIPGHCVFDNGRAFASKWITGGAPYRFRGREMNGDPLGLMASLGIQIHFTTPYRGQSKPIERAFGDLERNIGTHPAFAGAYTGRSPLHKPENYGERAIPLADFMAVLEAGIAEHNAREGRRTEAAAGRSFDTAYFESYRASVITKATEADLRMALLTAEKVRSDRRNGSVSLFGNSYWSPELLAYAGKPLTVRFDPDNLHSDVHLYDLATGIYLATAPISEAVGFFDVAAAKLQAKRVADARRKAREAIAAQHLVDIQTVAAAYSADAEEQTSPEPAAVRPMRVRGGASAALKPAEAAAPRLLDRLNLDDLVPERKARPDLRLVES